MDTQILIKRNPDNRHSTTRDIAYQRNRRQRTRSINLIAVNDILIAADEDTQDTVAEDHGGCQRRPNGDIAVACPAHPEETDWDGGRAEHGEPEAEFRGQAVIAGGVDFGHLATGERAADYEDEGGGEEEADCYAEETETGYALFDVLVR